MAFFQLNSRASAINEEMLKADAFEETPANLSYPSDLFSDNASYGNAYTAFFISVHADEELAKVKDFSKKSMNRDIKLTAQSVMNLVSRSSKYGQFFVVPDKPGLQFKENTGNRSYYYKFKAEAFDLHVQDGCYGIHR